MVEKISFFLDSNVILSGLISPLGPPRILLDLLTLNLPSLEGMTGQYNLDEIERNLKSRFPQLLPVFQKYRPVLSLRIIEVPSYEMIRDLLRKMSPKDAPVLASARLGNADYLVTGNQKDFPKKIAEPIKVVNPREFLSLLARLLRLI